MAEIILETTVKAPLERVFDLARSIDFHCHSAASTQEKTIAGVTQGLINLNEEVTWRARHFFVWQNLTVRITEFDRPAHFRDVMVSGAFRRMRHDHYFTAIPDNGTLILDVFNYDVPLSVVGRIVDKLVLKRYLRSFLIARNDQIKDAAETDAWKNFLPQSS